MFHLPKAPPSAGFFVNVEEWGVIACILIMRKQLAYILLLTNELPFIKIQANRIAYIVLLALYW